MLAITSKNSYSDVYVTKFVNFNAETLEDAKSIFLDYKKNKIILNDSFDDNTWIITNEAETKTLDFTFSEVIFYSQKKEPNNRDLGEYNNFISAIKIYFIYALEYTTIKSVQAFLSFIKKVVLNTKYFNNQYTENMFDKININAPNFLLMLIELIDFLPFGGDEKIQDYCKNFYYEINERIQTEKHGKSLQQRQLAEFQSYFYFDKLLNQFWDYVATDFEKLMYYPIYIWWKITNILPLRPTELIVTPYDCIRPGENNTYFLTIRRTDLKGAKKRIKHKVSEDYTPYEYQISEEIANIILDYKKRVDKYNKSKSKFLFSREAYYHLLGSYGKSAEKRSLNEEFTLNHLRTILSRFYINIIQNKFGIRLYSNFAD